MPEHKGDLIELVIGSAYSNLFSGMNDVEEGGLHEFCRNNDFATKPCPQILQIKKRYTYSDS